MKPFDRLTRRHLLASLPAVSAGVCLEARAQRSIFHRKPRPAAQPATTYAFFGTDTQRGGPGVLGARFDPATGRFTQPALMVPHVRASWMAVDPARNRSVVYLTDERDAQASGVVACVFDPGQGTLQEGQRSAGGSGPTYLAVDPTGQCVFTADYGGGSITGYRIQPDGGLGTPASHTDLRVQAIFGGHGPNRERQDAAHPHACIFSPSDRFLVVADLGTDALIAFPVDAPAARLGTPHVTHTRRAGAGPRHMVFHPNGRWLYVVDELSNEIDQYLWNTTRGAAGSAGQATLTDTARTVSTVAPGFKGPNTAAEILLSPDGRYLYVSNRGEDSVALFAVEEHTGALSPLGRIACGGRTPRHMTFDQTGRWLVVANLESSNVAVFARDEATGRVSGPASILSVPAPMFTLFA